MRVLRGRMAGWRLARSTHGTYTASRCRRAPKVLLHDHLDGGLRPQTILELAAEIGHELPARRRRGAGATGSPRPADSGSLERYLETFDHTVAVMQTAAALTRVARECVEDLAADGVVYAEVRYAPEQHVDAGPHPRRGRRRRPGGLRRGRRRGGRRARSSYGSCSPRCGTRPARWRSPSWPSPGATAAWPGFDIAGAEAGYPPTRHLDAFEYLQRENSHFTIHAGEAFGLPSIWQAIQWCGADRLGHGVRIIDDITVADDGTVELGRLAAYVRDKRIPLEMCPASNVQTGAADVASPSTRSGC